MSVEDSPWRLRVGAWFRQRPTVMRAVGLLAVVAGIAYYVARAGSGVGVHPVLFATLYTAELLSLLAFIILIAGSWTEPIARRPTPLNALVDVVLTIDTADPDAVEPAIVAALSMRGRTLLHLVDEGSHPPMRALADRYGVEYRVVGSGRAAAINAVLPDLEGDLVLLLDAHQIAAPDLLDALTGYFRDPETVLVHSGRAVRVGDVLTEAVVPPFAASDAALWDGSAALARRSALVMIGGMASDTATPHLETALLLQRTGGRVHYHHESLVQEAGDSHPENVTSGALRRFTLGRAGWAQRISDLGTLLAVLAPFQHLVLFAALVLVALPGVEPLTQPGALIAVLWITWVALSWAGVVAFERGSRSVHRGLVDLTPAMVASSLPLAMFVLALAVIMVRWADSAMRLLGGPGFLPPIDDATLAALSALGVVLIVILLRYAGLLNRGPRQRRLWRFEVDLRATVDGSPARCIDLHQSGASFIMPSTECAVGDRVAIEIECRSVDDVATVAAGHLRVTSVRPASASGSTMRVGGPVEWATPDSRRAVIEYCYVAQPYSVRTARSRETRLPVELHARIGGLSARCIDMSREGAAFLVAESVWKVGETVVAEVQLLDGTLAQGFLRVRTVVPAGEGRVRLGGEASWNETAWLDEYVSVRPEPPRSPDGPTTTR